MRRMSLTRTDSPAGLGEPARHQGPPPEADGLLKPMATLTPEQRALIASIEVMQETEHRGRVIKVRLRDQIRALELLARHKAMFPKAEPPPANMQVPTVVKIVHQHYPAASVTSSGGNGHAEDVTDPRRLPGGSG